MSDIQKVLPILYCQPIDFLDKIDELYIGQVLVVTRYSKKNNDIINEAWIRDGNTSYRKINPSDTQINVTINTNGDENNVIVREE